MWIVLLGNSNQQMYVVGNNKGEPFKSEAVARRWAKKYSESTFSYHWNVLALPIHAMTVDNAPIPLAKKEK